MLQSMRTAISSWTVKILLAALVLSFVSFYGWQGGKELGTGVLASVDGDSITTIDFQNRFQSMLEVYRNMGLLRGDVSEEMMKLIQGSILNGMIDERLKIRAAKEFGLVASEKQVKETIEKQFSASTGKFDFDLYKKILRARMGKNPAAFEKEQADSLLAKEFDELFEKTSFVSHQELRQTYEMRNDKVSLSFVTLDPEKLSKKISVPSVTEAEIKSHFETHKSQYEIPEARKMEVAWYNVNDFLEPKEYELEKILHDLFPNKNAQDVQGERIRAAQILFRTTKNNESQKSKRAHENYLKLKQGADFDRLARAESEHFSQSEGGDLGYFGKGKYPKNVEQALIAMHIGEISNPIKSPEGFHILKLIDRIPAGERSMTRLRRELVYLWRKKNILSAEMSEKKEQTIKNMENRLKQGKAKIGQNSLGKLKMDDPLIRLLETDFVSMGHNIGNLEDGNDSSLILRAAQSLSNGATSDPVKGWNSEHVYVVRLLSVKPPRIPSLDEVKAKISEEVLKEKRKDALRSYAKNLLEKWMHSKKPIETLAKEEGLGLEHTDEFSRAPDHRIPKIGVSESGISHAFKRPKEEPFIPEPIIASDKIHLASLRKKIMPDWTVFEKEKESLRKVAEEEAGRERVRTFTASLKTKAKITKAKELSTE